MDEDGDDEGMPFWVKFFIAIGLIFVLLLVAVLVFAGGQHGPGRHVSSGDGPSGTHGAGDNHDGDRDHDGRGNHSEPQTTVAEPLSVGSDDAPGHLFDYDAAQPGEAAGYWKTHSGHTLTPTALERHAG